MKGVVLDHLPAFHEAERALLVRSRDWVCIQVPKSKAELEAEVDELCSHNLGCDENDIHEFRDSGGYLRRWYEAYELLCVPNLKFFPTCTSFDEAAFKQLIFNARPASVTAADMVDDLMFMDFLNLWTAKARVWVEEGIRSG